MIKKTIIFSLALLFLPFIYFYFHTSSLIHVNKEASITLSSQQRTSVEKEAYIVKDNKRAYFHLEAPTSTLYLLLHKGSLQLKEKMENLQLWTIDNILKAPYEIRYFHAKEGSYLFPSHQFFSNDVDIAFCYSNTVEKFSLEEPFLQGSAKKISLLFFDKAPLLHLSSFKANIDFSRQE